MRTVAFVLKREADSPRLSGTHVVCIPETTVPYVTFHYEVRRVWQMPPETFLSGGPGLLPLAPISDVPETQVPAIIQRMRQRMGELKVRRKTAATLWGCTHILLGLRFSKEFAGGLLRGVLAMKESTTYQAIIEEGVHIGELRALAAMLRRICEPKLGGPNAVAAKALEAITEVGRLQDLVLQAPDAESWESLLGVPARPARRRKP